MIAISMIVLSSCYPLEKEPDLGLTEEKIIKILVDLHVAQSAVKKFPVKQRDSVNVIYKKQIARVHNVNEQEIDSLVVTLEEYPNFYYDLNSKVLEELENLEEEALEKTPKEENDFGDIKK